MMPGASPEEAPAPMCLPMTKEAHRTVLTLVAETGAEFSDFAPYVPSINDAGLIAFQATLRSGGSCVGTYAAGASQTLRLSWGGSVANVCSHPDLDHEGAVAVYCALADGAQAVAVHRAGRVLLLADTGGELSRIGPLGPTMNAEGTIAFRADLRRGGAGVFMGRQGRVTRLADTERFPQFHGLPVVLADETVVFRADDKSGGQGIYARGVRATEVIAQTGSDFSKLGAFPSANDRGAVAFVAARHVGDTGVFVAEAGRVRAVQLPEGGFESFRGALINNRGTVFFFATPIGGTLGIYAAQAKFPVRVLGLGDAMAHSTVGDFALNAVSLNNLDQLAVRVVLADGGQRIVRVELVA
jgi:hypothetical protein